MEQGLDELAAALDEKRRPVLLLQFRNVCRRIIQRDRVLPRERLARSRGDVLGDPVEGIGDRIVFESRPVRGKDLVGLATDQQVERAAEDFTHRLAHDIVPVGERPAAVAEAARRVFLGAARCLHHTVQAQEDSSDYFSHVGSPDRAKGISKTIGEARFRQEAATVCGGCGMGSSRDPASDWAYGLA